MRAEAAKKKQAAVLGDTWTQEQQLALESACMAFPWTMDRTERWNAIARLIPATASKGVGEPVRKTRNQCVRRYRYLKEMAIKLRPPQE